MRILHTYCLNYNMGDYALGVGLKNLLRETFDVSLIGETNIQGREFNKYYIEEVVNKKYDLLVIGGGGIIHGSHWPNGWFWLIEKQLIKTIKIPFVVYGVGNNYFEHEKIPARAVDHLNETNQYAKFFSVRNDGSYERVIDQLSFKPEEVPDPGFHVALNKSYPAPKADNYIIVQLANDKPDQRFESVQFEKFKDGIVTNLQRLSNNYKIIFIPHVLDDVVLSKEISSRIKNSEVLHFGDYAFDHIESVISYYMNAEFVIAMRGHGQIVPIGLNVPVIALHNHPKHKGLMQKLGLSEYSVDINADTFSKDLTVAVDKLVTNKTELVEAYHEINQNFLAASKQAMQTMKRKM